MAWSRVTKAALAIATGAVMLQTTSGGCAETLGPLVANVLSSVVLNALLGGLAT